MQGGTELKTKSVKSFEEEFSGVSKVFCRIAAVSEAVEYRGLVSIN